MSTINNIQGFYDKRLKKISERGRKKERERENKREKVWIKRWKKENDASEYRSTSDDVRMGKSESAPKRNEREKEREARCARERKSNEKKKQRRYNLYF